MWVRHSRHACALSWRTCASNGSSLTKASSHLMPSSSSRLVRTGMRARVRTEPRCCAGFGFVIRGGRLQPGGGDGGPILALGRPVGGDRTVHAPQPARARAQRRPAGHLRHPSRDHRRLPLVRLPGRVRSAHHDLQPLQPLVPPRLLAGDSGRPSQGGLGRLHGRPRQHLCLVPPLRPRGKGGLARKGSARRAAAGPRRSTRSPTCSAAPASFC